MIELIALELHDGQNTRRYLDAQPSQLHQIPKTRFGSLEGENHAMD